MKTKTFSSSTLKGCDTPRHPKLVSDVKKNKKKTNTSEFFSPLLSPGLIAQLPDVAIRFSVLNLREPGGVLRTRGLL